MIALDPRGPNVSRGTFARLTAFAEVLVKWNTAINLVSRDSLNDLWNRHILDSAQLFDLRPAGARHWADLGSGAGFPGLVIAILAAEAAPELEITLVESDARKVSFLHAAARASDVAPRIICARAESLDPLGADVLSARALAPLDVLLDYCDRHLRPGGRALFPKGRKHADEVAAALETWRFTVQKYPSLTDASGAILSIEGISRA